MAGSYQNRQKFLSRTMSHLSSLTLNKAETRVFLALSLRGTVTQFTSLKQQKKNPKQKKPNSSLSFAGAGGWIRQLNQYAL